MAEEKKACESCGQTVHDAWIDPFEHFGKMHSSIIDIWNRLDSKLNGEVVEKEEAKETQEQNSDEQEESDIFYPFSNLLKLPKLFEKNLFEDFKDAQPVKVQNDENGFELELNTEDYDPEDIKVRVENGMLVIEGNHDEDGNEEDSKVMHRKFYREYLLPDECKPENVSSTFTKDGILKISAPKLAIENK